MEERYNGSCIEIGKGQFGNAVTLSGRKLKEQLQAITVAQDSMEAVGALVWQIATKKSLGLSLFEQNTLSRADQEKGRLRTYLLGSLQNFLLKQRERISAIKRGGNQQLVSFDLHLPETEAAMQATAHLDQVSCYDLTWASTIVKRSWQQ